MKVALAKKTGFCFGVKRAVAMAEAELRKNRRIYSLGSIIHNKEVVEDLARRGLKMVKRHGSVRDGVLIISSHGISPKVAAGIKKRGLKIVDTTCPFVLNAQNIARALKDEGYKVIIVGDAKHPEVRALIDFAPGSVVIKNKSDAKALKLAGTDRVSVISQTTQSTGNFLETVKAIAKKKPKELKVVNTICRDAGDRQDAARHLAREVDVMLIVGGLNSANTRRLFEVSRKICRRSYHIETEKDLKPEWFKSGSVIGITSGASTPDCIIGKVVQEVSKSKNKKKGRL